MKSMVYVALAGTVALTAAPVQAIPVVLAVAFTLTDLDYKPLQG